MTTRIYKYQVRSGRDGLFEPIPMPVGATVLSVDAQKDQLYVWAMVDAELVNSELRTFAVYGTGWDIDPVEGKDLKFVGTALMHGGLLVWHVFELVAAAS